MRFNLALFLLPVAAVADQPSENAICIRNGAEHTHFFTTETREGVRQTATLSPGGLLCSGPTDAADGIVGVFETPEALEGCGRIIDSGSTEELIAYAEFDRCQWGGHDK